MTDLTKGIIEINGFTFKPGTTKEEVLAFFGDKVRVLELSTGPRVKFTKPFYIAENLYAYAFNFSKEGVLKNFSLIPVPPSSIKDCGYGEIPKAKLVIAKEWLKSLINVAPATDCEEGISYHFGGVHISAFTHMDIHYGLEGGNIDLCFDNEV